MTDRPLPTDDDLLFDALEQEPGHDSSLSPSLRAELEGLRAVRGLLRDDAVYGERSGLDVPPPHLLDAILRAEVLARPDVVRQAVAARVDPSSTTTKAAAPWWQRVSSWFVGGGVVVAGAAALLVTVQRSPEVSPPAPPMMDQAAVATSPSPSVMAEAMPPPPPAAPADALGFAGPPAELQAEAEAMPKQEPVSTATKAATIAEARELANDKAKSDGFGLAKDAAVAKNVAGNALRDGDAASSIGGLGSAGTGAGGGGKGRADGDAFADDAVEGAVAEKKAAPAAARASAPAQPAPVMPPSPTTPTALAPPPVTTGTEVRRAFQERLAAKEEARKEASAPAKAKKVSESVPLSGPAARARDHEQLERDRMAQEANGILVTAENELSRGRFATAVDLAQRAEAAAGGTLGLAPASTQARAYLGLKRPADAVRVGSRLLNGNAGDPQIVDGLLAAAQAALQIGDRPMAQRLVQHALHADNVDVARRARAQGMLNSIRAVPAADAPAAAAAKPSP